MSAQAGVGLSALVGDGTWVDEGLGTDTSFSSGSDWRNNLNWDTLVLI